MIRSVKAIKGFTIKATDGEIGAVDDLFFDEDSWSVRYIVVDTGKWLHGRKVLVSPVAVREGAWPERVIPVNLTLDRVHNSPDFATDRPVTRQAEAEYHDYFRWPYYWTQDLGPGSAPASYMGGGVEPPPADATRTARHEGDPNLHSAREVMGYHVQCNDGEFGHIEDIMFDDDGWLIRYFLVGTRNWMPGKKVLVGLPWIERIHWQESRVFFDLSRGSFESAPEYDPAKTIDREMEIRLFEHYAARERSVTDSRR